MTWNEVPRCPGCFRLCPVGIMSLAVTCKCGMYWADVKPHEGWYYSRESYESGNPPFTTERGAR